MGGGVGDDDAVDEFGAGGEHARVVGGVDRLGQVAPARQRGDAVLAEELDGGQDVGAGRQQSAVAEGAEDAGVVGGGGAQVEELPFGGGDGLVEQFPQFLGEVVELFGGEGAAGGVAQCRGGALGAPGALGALAFVPAAGRGLGSRPGARDARPCRPGRAGRGRRRGAGQAEQLREALLGGQGLGEPQLGLVGAGGGRGRVGRAGGGQFGAGLGRGGLAGQVRGPAGGLAGGVPGRDRVLLGVTGGERGAGRVGVGRAVVEPAGPHGLGRLLLDLGEPLAQVSGLTAGALCLGGRRGGVPVGGLARLLKGGRALLLLVGESLGLPGGRAQGPYEVDGRLGAGGEGGCRVPFGLADGGGHAGGAVGGGTVAQHDLGGLPRGVQGAGVGEFPFLGGRPFSAPARASEACR